MITTPKKNKLASSTLGEKSGNTSSEPAFKKQNTGTGAESSAAKTIQGKIGGKKKDKEEEKEEINITSHNLISYSKQENNYHLSNKKAIYYNMKVYYDAIGTDYHANLPVTFHIKEGLTDPAYHKFEMMFNDAQHGKETILDNYPK